MQPEQLQAVLDEVKSEEVDRMVWAGPPDVATVLVGDDLGPAYGEAADPSAIPGWLWLLTSGAGLSGLSGNG